MSRRTTHLLRAALVLAVCLVTSASMFFPAAAGAAHSRAVADEPQLVLWNSLGNEHQVTHSIVGPDLKLRYQAPGCWAVAEPRFVAGVAGRSLTIDHAIGANHPGNRVCNAVITRATALYTPDRGTIQLAFKVNKPAHPYVNGIYRLYNGAFGPGDGGPNLAITGAGKRAGARLYFAVGGTQGGVTATSLITGDGWIDVSDSLGVWVDAVAMWDRSGIDGTSDTLRLYLDGTLVASASDPTWQPEMNRYVDVAGANDYKLSRKFAVDELKVWNGVTFAPLGG